MEGPGDRTTAGAPDAISHDDKGAAQAANGLVFVKEDELRDRIVESPSEIPEIDEPAAAAKEVAIPPAIGRADVVVVGADGVITIVECKLEGNPSSHGSVIGQALSYAAGLRGLSYEKFRKRFEEGAASLTKPFEGDSSWNEAWFKRRVEQNLKTGSFRLTIALDQMPPALQHTLAFLEGREPKGIRFSSAVLGFPMPKLDRQVLIEMIRQRSGPPAARAADRLLQWALKDERRLSVHYGRIDGVVKTRVDTLSGSYDLVKYGSRLTRSPPSLLLAIVTQEHGSSRVSRRRAWYWKRLRRGLRLRPSIPRSS